MTTKEAYATYIALNQLIVDSNKNLHKVELALGLGDTLYCDTVEDRSFNVYKCKQCETRWGALMRVPCWKCHAEAFVLFDHQIQKKVTGEPLGDCDPEFLPQPHL